MVPLTLHTIFAFGTHFPLHCVIIRAIAVVKALGKKGGDFIKDKRRSLITCTLLLSTVKLSCFTRLGKLQ